MRSHCRRSRRRYYCSPRARLPGERSKNWAGEADRDGKALGRTCSSFPSFAPAAGAVHTNCLQTFLTLDAILTRQGSTTASCDYADGKFNNRRQTDSTRQLDGDDDGDGDQPNPSGFCERAKQTARYEYAMVRPQPPEHGSFTRRMQRVTPPKSIPTCWVRMIHQLTETNPAATKCTNQSSHCFGSLKETSRRLLTTLDPLSLFSSSSSFLRPDDCDPGDHRPPFLLIDKRPRPSTRRTDPHLPTDEISDNSTRTTTTTRPQRSTIATSSHYSNNTRITCASPTK